MGVSTLARKGGQAANDDQTTMLVRKIPDGSVIDHIAAGKALSVLRLLGNPQENGFTIAMVMNVSSSKMGRKDIVKVEGMEVSQEQVAAACPDRPKGEREHRALIQGRGEEERCPSSHPARDIELHRPDLRVRP